MASGNCSIYCVETGLHPLCICVVHFPTLFSIAVYNCFFYPSLGDFFFLERKTILYVCNTSKVHASLPPPLYSEEMFFFLPTGIFALRNIWRLPFPRWGGLWLYLTSMPNDSMAIRYEGVGAVYVPRFETESQIEKGTKWHPGRFLEVPT